jgi:hypothetical protein
MTRLLGPAWTVQALVLPVLAVAVLAVAVLAGASAVAAATEEPRFAIVVKDGSFEVRAYEPQIIAEVAVEGDRDAAINAGFRILAAYIFGANIPGASIAMTAPVTQQAGESIAMTAPVTQAPAGKGWLVRFTMPASYRMETLPKPKDAHIRLIAVPARRMAVVRFSGLATQTVLDERAAELAGEIARRKLRPVGRPLFAFYDPPWTLPFLRRNEVMQEIR